MTEVNLIPFKHKHLPLVLELLKSRQYAGISDITTKTLPKIGYIAMLGDQPVACGFLRRLEPFYAQLDTLASSSYFGSDIRHLGINKCVFALIDDAKRLKLKGIISHTSDPGILSRAASIGFYVVEQTIIAKPL